MDRIEAPASLDEIERAREWFASRVAGAGEDIHTRARVGREEADRAIAALLGWVRKLGALLPEEPFAAARRRLRERVERVWSPRARFASNEEPTSTAAQQLADRVARERAEEERVIAALRRRGPRAVFRHFLASPGSCAECIALDGLVLPTGDVRWRGGGTPRHPYCGCSTRIDASSGAPGADATDDDLRAYLGSIAQATWLAIQAARAAGQPQVTLSDGTILEVNQPDLGPCLTVGLDTGSGQVLYGQNVLDDPPLEPLLQQRRWRVARSNESRFNRPPGYPRGWTRRMGTPGRHSETLVLNQALRARPAARPSDVAIYNVRTEDIDASPAPPMPRCGNCRRMTNGVRALTD